MDIFEIDCLIIGGGVSGLAIGCQLSKIYKNIFLIEKNNNLAQEASSRNSEVIHAGIYYEPNSLKSKFCIEGKHLLYEYLQLRNIPHKRCGKYIISTNESETDKLEGIYKNAINSGLEDLELDHKEIEKYDFLSFQKALFSPSSGIFDSHEYLLSLKLEFEQNGGNILLNNESVNIESSNSKFRILVKDKNTNQEFLVETKVVINSAGLNAVKLVNQIYEEDKFSLKLIKGDYYSYSKRTSLEHLIYPLPNKDSLGIHVTLDLGKGIRFGPSAYEVDEIDYNLSTSSKNEFLESISSYWPSINEKLLAPDFSGIRAKISQSEDFIIDKKVFNDHFMISILNYISPGLTCSLAMSKYVKSLILNI